MMNLSTQHGVISTPGVDAAFVGFAEFNKGVQAMSASFADYLRRAIELQTETLERLTEAKSVEHALEIQSAHVQAALDDYMFEADRLGSLYGEMMRDAFAPLDKMKGAA